MRHAIDAREARDQAVLKGTFGVIFRLLGGIPSHIGPGGHASWQNTQANRGTQDDQSRGRAIQNHRPTAALAWPSHQAGHS